MDVFWHQVSSLHFSLTLKIYRPSWR